MPETHAKLACGDPQVAFRVALLDPALTVSQPASVTATSGFDAIAHAVETFVTTKRNPLVRIVLARSMEASGDTIMSECLAHPDDLEARGAMQLGASCGNGD